MVPVRTLVVDDSAAVRKSLSLLLEAQPQLEVVGTAENGREAVDKVAELAPDVVLMDLQMPEMNGLDATMRIRCRHPAVLVIVVTTYDSAQVRAACKRAGADGFVPKAAGALRILDEIERVVSSAENGDSGENES
ncbi:MAG TPA: response regulator transcription factor [Vicinamibacteria bacterium]|nr:response regulator transcription factor [Vicinamibacteria bacterium]